MIIITDYFDINFLKNFDNVGLTFNKITKDIDKIKEYIKTVVKDFGGKSYLTNEKLANFFNLKVNKEEYNFDYTDRIYLIRYNDSNFSETSEVSDGEKIELWEIVRAD